MPEEQQEKRPWNRGPGAWLRWIAFVEGLVLLLAIAGPGRRRRPSQREESHGLIARWFMEDPNWFEATAINFVVMNVGVFSLLGIAILATRWRRQGKRGERSGA